MEHLYLYVSLCARASSTLKLLHLETLRCAGCATHGTGSTRLLQIVPLYLEAKLLPGSSFLTVFTRSLSQRKVRLANNVVHLLPPVYCRYPKDCRNFIDIVNSSRRQGIRGSKNASERRQPMKVCLVGPVQRCRAPSLTIPLNHGSSPLRAISCAEWGFCNINWIPWALLSLSGS